MHFVSAKKHSRKKKGSSFTRRAFTLIELLIVIAILGILATAVVVVLRPGELLRQTRDAQRLADLDSLSTILKLADNDGQNLGASPVVYLSLPDTSSTCASYGLATSTGYTYHCSTTSTYQNTDGTGWIPVDFDAVGTFSVPRLPVDPAQNATSSLYYSYTPGGGRWELNALMESDAYSFEGTKDIMSTDGGDAYWRYEKGTSLTLTPEAADIPTFAVALTHSLVPERGGVGTFTRASVATVMGYAATANAADGQTLLTVASGEARFRGARRVSEGVWSKTFADGTPIPDATLLGYFAEGSRTNLILRSQEFDNASWGKVRATSTANAAMAPDGTLTMDKLVEDATAGNSHFVNQNVVKAASAITYTTSLYAKVGERTRLRVISAGDSGLANGIRVDVDLTAGTLSGGTAFGASPFTYIGSTIEALADGWYRITLTGTSNTTTALVTYIQLANAAGSVLYDGDGASGLYIWQAQVEAATFASTPIVTTSAAVTRAGDVLSYPISNAPAGPLTVMLEFVRFANAINDSDPKKAPLSIGVYATDPFISFGGYIAATNSTHINFLVDFGTIWDLSPNLFTSHADGVSAEIALTMAADLATFRGYRDGILSGATPVTSANAKNSSWGGAIYIASNSGGAGVNQSLSVRDVRIWPSALTDAQIAAQ